MILDKKMTTVRSSKEIKLNKLFAGVEASIVDSLLNTENFKEFNEGEVIYRSGDESNYIYLLLRGDVKIKFLPHNYISNKIFNDFFGEKEIFDKTRRNSSAVADSKCLLYLIEKANLEKLLNKTTLIKSNIDLYGELDLPEIELVTNDRLNIANKDKPISFRPALPKQQKKENNDNGSDEISDVISSIIREKNPITDSYVSKDSENGAEEIPIDDDFDIELDDDTTIFEVEKPLIESEKVIEEEKVEATDENVQEPVDIKKIFEALNNFNNYLGLPETLQSIIDETKILSSSTAGEIYLVDEDLSEMSKFVIENTTAKVVRHRTSEGLTGTCALQKKTLNFENPAEDSRFSEEIDQPGDKNLKKIIFIPFINNEQKLIAVLQLARENEPYSDIEIRHLETLNTQAAIAIERSKKYEKSLEEEKQRSGKNVEMFLLDNVLIPLDLINRYSYILSKDETSQTAKSVISMLQQQANLLWDIVQSTLEYSKREIDLEPEELSINSYINNISELLAEYCDSRNINFYKKTGEDANIKIDGGKLFMAIYQIVRNACDSSIADSNIYISTKLDNDSVHIDIRDEGSGIEDKMKEKLFSPGFSRDKGRNRLGMTIAKKITEAHNAQISFSSKKNKGTTFRISIPVYTSSE
jgi:signal transduction histidine kinase